MVAFLGSALVYDGDRSLLSLRGYRMESFGHSCLT